MQSIWVSLGVSILLLGLGSLLTDPRSLYVENELFAFMLLLTFPVGILAASCAVSLIPTDTPAIAIFVLVWLSMFSTAYAQWFILMPFGRRSNLIRLGLATCEQNKSNPDPIYAPMTRQRRVKRRSHVSIRAFDTKGRTPLERAIKLKPLPRWEITSVFDEKSRSSKRR